MLTKLQTALRLLPPAAQRTDSAGKGLASLNPSTKHDRGCRNNNSIPVVDGEDQKFKVTLSYIGRRGKPGLQDTLSQKAKSERIAKF